MCKVIAVTSNIASQSKHGLTIKNVIFFYLRLCVVFSECYLMHDYIAFQTNPLFISSVSIAKNDLKSKKDDYVHFITYIHKK